MKIAIISTIILGCLIMQTQIEAKGKSIEVKAQGEVIKEIRSAPIKDRLALLINKRSWQKAFFYIKKEQRESPQLYNEKILSLFRAATTYQSTNGKYLFIKPFEVKTLKETLKTITDTNIKLKALKFLLSAFLRQDQQKDVDALIKEFSEPRLLKYYYKKRLYYLGLRGNQALIKTLLQKKEYQPFSFTAYEGIIQYFIDKNRYAKALETLSLIKDPSQEDFLRLQIGNHFIKNFKSMKSLITFTEGFHQSFFQDDFLSKYCIHLLELKHIKKVEKLLFSDLISSDQKMYLLNNLGTFYIQNNEAKKTKRIIQRLKKDYPKDSTDLQDNLWMELTLFYIENKDKNRAQICINAISSQDIKDSVVKILEIGFRESI